MRTDIEEKVLEKLATSDKATIVVERQSDGKMRVTSGSWDGEKVILRDQVLEVRNVDGHLSPARSAGTTSGTPMSRPTIPTALATIGSLMTDSVSADAGTISADGGTVSADGADAGSVSNRNGQSRTPAFGSIASKPPTCGPEEVQYLSIFSAAIVAGSKQVDADQGLIHFLGSEAAEAAIRRSGRDNLRAQQIRYVAGPIF
jgi:hypothetical protein